MGEEVVTWKLYLGLAFTIPTLERVPIGCCEVDGGGGGGGGGGEVFGGEVFGGSVVKVRNVKNAKCNCEVVEILNKEWYEGAELES
ncbi:hypothetical protein Tco_0601942 [Tanacetum coccineum]